MLWGARRRVRGARPMPSADLASQRTVVEAYLRAVRDGGFDALVAVLDPQVVLRADVATGPDGGLREVEVRGAAQAQQGSRIR